MDKTVVPDCDTAPRVKDDAMRVMCVVPCDDCTKAYGMPAMPTDGRHT